MVVLDLCSTFLCAMLLIRWVCVSGLTSLWSLLVMEYGKKKSYLKRRLEFKDVYFLREGTSTCVILALRCNRFLCLSFLSSRNVKGSQEVVDFVADRLREQKKNNQLNLTKICEEVSMHLPVRSYINLRLYTKLRSCLIKNKKLSGRLDLRNFSRAFSRMSSLRAILIGSFH